MSKKSNQPKVAQHRRSGAKFTARDLPLWKAKAERNVKIAEGKPVGRRSR